MRWTRQRRARVESQGGFRPVSDRGAQTNGAEAYGKTVWSWHPLLVSSWRRFCEPNRVRQIVNSPTTVTRRIRRRGERGINRKTIAQGRPEAPADTCMLVCASLNAHLHTRPRVPASTRPSLRPLFQEGGRFQQSSGETRREIANPCQRPVIASEAKQSILSLRGEMDCFASLAMTNVKLSRLFEN